LPFRVVADDLAPIHGDDALPDSIDDALIVRRDDDGGAELVDLLQDLDDLEGVDRVEVAGRLVGDDELGLIDDRAADGDALLLAARELVGEMLRLVGEIHELEDIGHVARDLGVGAAGRLHREGDVLVRGLVGDEAEVLEDHADLAAVVVERGGGQIVDIDRFKKDRPSVGALQRGGA
jgi:hypothetical protein